MLYYQGDLQLATEDIRIESTYSNSATKLNLDNEWLVEQSNEAKTISFETMWLNRGNNSRKNYATMEVACKIPDTPLGSEMTAAKGRRHKIK